MPEEAQISATPWDELAKIIDSNHAAHLEAFLQLLPPEETPYTIARLSEEHRTHLFELVSPEFAADFLDHFEDDQVADVIEELPAETAAAIVDELDSDDQADILLELDEADAEAIIEKMDPEEVKDVRALLEYGPDTAGGIMFTEYLAYAADTTVETVINDLRMKKEEYEDYEIRYMYVVDEEHHLAGVVRLRQLILAQPSRQLGDIMRTDPIRVSVDKSLDEIEDVFDRHNFTLIPVVDESDHLIGVIDHADLQENIGERAEDNLGKLFGIIRGEELRSMGLWERCVRRLAFLAPNIPLFIASAFVIAQYEHVIKQVTALAIFLPLVAGMSGAAGNQSIAVSIRELSLGLLKPNDVMRVLGKEIMLGVVNGIVIGAIIGIVAMLMRADYPMLGPVVGGAIALTSIFGVVLGAVIPLLLKKWNIDPAMAAAPILMTFIDIAGFFIVLNLALALMEVSG